MKLVSCLMAIFRKFGVYKPRRVNVIVFIYAYEYTCTLYPNRQELIHEFL